MRLLKRLLATVFMLLVLAGGLYCYARLIEPRLMVTERYAMQSELVDGQVRVALFGDTQLGNGFELDGLQKAVDKINALEPDVVIFLGDLIDNFKEYDGSVDEVAAVLSQVRAGRRYAVKGNHDIGGGAEKVYAGLVEQAGYTLLVNEHELIEQNVNVIGVDEMIFGNPSADGLIEDGRFNLLIAHEPDFADRVTGVQLQVSGHTHGEQVRLPFMAKYILPYGGRHYIRGACEKEDGGVVYVNRGLGMSVLPYRFCSVPEITEIVIN